ncbi:hypothetical protein PVAND_013850 [Polypedilum vanderplanki]|uniref:RRM domain-containing protein n=1 Tax=Polypedilum vanderplanki TaxID=319348 RepID=A0A9J6CRV6_POLVA|nr:hypothetical protein PVAND_013850 [Polypedilum vanderplanki]
MVRSIHKLFVSNLPWTVGSTELKKYFQQLGCRVISANVVFDKKTGLSQRYGFVEVNRNTLPNLENKENRLEGNKIFYQSAD